LEIQKWANSIFIASTLMALNLAIGLFATIIFQTSSISNLSSIFALLEVGIFLILGSFMFAREPIEDDRLNESKAVNDTRYKIGRIGRLFLLTAVILFVYSIIVSIAGQLFLF
jgi:Na+/alanine symporter